MESFKTLILSLLAAASLSIQAQEMTDFYKFELARTLSTEPPITYYLSERKPESAALLVILQGSDCKSVVSNKTIRSTLSQLLSETDVLLIEKWGLRENITDGDNCPESYIQNDSPSQRVADVQRVLAELSAHHNYRDIFVLGGSEGAVIATLLRAEEPSVTGTVVFNGGGAKFQDDIEHNIRQSTPPEVTESVLKEFRQFAETIKTSTQAFEVNSSQHGYKWWQESLSLNQTEVIQRGDTPLLIIQAGKDDSVDPQKVKQMIESLGDNAAVDYSYFPELDHGLRAHGSETIDEKVLTIMAKWFKSKSSK